MFTTLQLHLFKHCGREMPVVEVEENVHMHFKFNVLNRTAVRITTLID